MRIPFKLILTSTVLLTLALGSTSKASGVPRLCVEAFGKDGNPSSQGCHGVHHLLVRPSTQTTADEETQQTHILNPHGDLKSDTAPKTKADTPGMRGFYVGIGIQTPAGLELIDGGRPLLTPGEEVDVTQLKLAMRNQENQGQ